MNSKDVLLSFITSFLESPDSHVAYISISQEDMSCIKDFIKVSHITYSLDAEVSPLAPFLDIIRKAKPSTQLIDKMVVPYQRQTFKSYLETGVAANRDDLFIDDTVSIEKKNISESIVSLLNNIKNKTYLILASEYLSTDTINFLKEYENRIDNGKFIFCFYANHTECLSNSLIEFRESLSLKPNFIEIMDYNIQINREKYNYNLKLKYKDIITSLRNARYFLFVEQGKHMTDFLEANADRFKFTNFQKRNILYETGVCHYYLKNYDEATLYFTSVMEFHKEDELDIEASFMLSKTYFMKRMNANALKHVLYVKQKLQNNQDRKLYALTCMMEYLTISRKNMELIKKRYFETMDILKKADLPLNYLSTAFNIPTELFYDVGALRTTILPIINDCYDLSQKINNVLEYSTACQIKGIIASYLGFKDESMEWYIKANDIRTNLGELLHVIRIRNSISFEYLSRSLYKDAYNIMNEKLGELDQLANYSTIVNALKNSALPLFYSHDYKQASQIFRLIIHIIKTFDFENTVNNSFIPSIADVVILRSAIELYEENYIQVKFNILNLKRENKGVPQGTLPIYKLIQSVMLLKEDNLESSIRVIEECISSMKEYSHVHYHIFVYVHYEYALYLDKFNYHTKSQEYFKRGHDLAIKYGFKYYITPNSLEEYKVNFIKHDKVTVNAEKLERKIEKDRISNSIHVRIQDYQFLNRIMTYSNRNKSARNYAKAIVQNLFDYLMPQTISIAEYSNNRWKVLATMTQDTTDTVDNDYSNQWNYFHELSKILKAKGVFFDKSTGCYYRNLTKFNFRWGVIIVPTKKGNITSETINALNIALTNIQNQFTLIKQKERLIQIGTIDQLSGLNNRRTLMSYLDTTSQKIINLREKRGETLIQTIGFIDLDNFKYYNDNYGHNIGDLIIHKFGELLKKTFRKVDFLARFGGDEFVIIFNETPESDSKLVANRLYEALVKAKHFIPDIKKTLQTPIDIPINKYINFSMGLCSNTDLEDITDLDKVLQNADKALYHSKNNGKGRFTLWKDIKDE